MKTIGQVQAFFGNGDQHVSADCDPDLRLDCVFVGAIKRLDAQVLLDPFEEQFDLPALLIQVRYQLGLECEVVGQERDAFATVVLDDHASQCGGIVLAGIENCQYTSLIAHDVGVGSVHGVGVAPLELGIGLGTGDEESVGLMNHKQSLEIQVAAIEQVVRARLDVQQVQGVDLVRLAVADVNECGDGAAQVQQGVQFDSRFVGSKRCPRINPVPTDKPTGTDLSSWHRRRRRLHPSRSPSALWHTTGAPWRSGVARSRRRFAKAGLHWRWTRCCEKRSCSADPCDTAAWLEHAN